MQSLATKWRPKTFDEVVEQDEVKVILQNQIKNNDIRNAYLFVGGAGTGKTTCARIFANELQSSVIEVDGASNNGVDQVREISQQARTSSTVSKYKVFIIDECHMITIQGWNAMLKLIEEPPLNTIFIFCTTNPEKIPKTILSRVQRYDFHRISWQGIALQLLQILSEENASGGPYYWEQDAVEYLAKLADGHMRDAITMMDKCLTYGKLDYGVVTDALGLAYHNDLKELMLSVMFCEDDNIIKIVEDIHSRGIDLSQLMKQELTFALDYAKWRITHTMQYCSCPDRCEEWFVKEFSVGTDVLNHYINTLLKIIETIKYDSNPKVTIEAMLLLESEFIRGLAVVEGVTNE